jgi:hypothetical protein
MKLVYGLVLRNKEGKLEGSGCWAHLEEDKDNYNVFIVQCTYIQIPKSSVNNRPELAILKAQEFHAAVANTAYMSYASKFSSVSVEERTRICGGLGSLFKLEREKRQHRIILV